MNRHSIMEDQDATGFRSSITDADPFALKVENRMLKEEVKRLEAVIKTLKTKERDLNELYNVKTMTVDVL